MNSMPDKASNLPFSPYLLRIKTYYDGMQSREKKILWLACATLTIFAIVNIYSFIEEQVAAQDDRMRKVINEVDLASAALYRYQVLKSRLAVIEEEYKSVQADANETYFERLLKQKAGITNAKDFNIRPRASKDFGGDYKQTAYFIKFTIVDPNRLIDFLKELAHGAKPVLFSRISIKPRSTKDALDVEIEIASIKKTKV